MLDRTAQIKKQASQFGLDYNYEIMKAANTLKAHRLTKWAALFGKAKDLTEALFYGLFTERIICERVREPLYLYR